MGKPRPRRPIILVDWIDAHAMGAWTQPKDIRNKPGIVQSVGYLVEPAPIDGHLTLACSDDGEGSVADGLHIPRSCVLRTRRLKVT